jgi:DNA invertase Pin-like site-specific DNA recombinase
MRGAIYSRVSTSFGRQNTDRQVQDLIKYAEQHGFIIDLDDIYEEYDSGYKSWLERKEFVRLKQKIDNDPNYYSGIFVWEISRIARDPIQGNDILSYLSLNKLCVYVKEPNLRSINPRGERDPMFNIYFTILMEFANTEAMLLKKRSRSGIRSKILDQKGAGYIVLPYGYKREPSSKKLIIEEKEGEVVKEIFNLCIQGHGTKTIAKILNSKNIPTRYNKSKKEQIVYKDDSRPPIDVKNITWKDGTIYGILTNTIYMGKRKLKPNIDEFEDGKIPKGLFDYFDVPNIVSEEIWDSAQLKLKANLKHSIRNTKYIYILKDLIKCSVCGGNYYGRWKADGKDKFYMCSSKRTKSRNCDNKGFSIELFEGIVWHQIEQSINYDIFNKIDEDNTLKKKQQEDLLYLNEQIKKEILEAQSKLSNARFNYLEDPIIFKDAYKKIEKKYSTKLKSLHKQIGTNTLQIESLNSEVKDYYKAKEVYKKLNKIKKNRLEIQSIAKLLFNKIYLYSYTQDYIFITIELKYQTPNGNIKIDFLVHRKSKSFTRIKEFGKIGNTLIFDKYGKLKNENSQLEKIINQFKGSYELIKPLDFLINS